MDVIEPLMHGIDLHGVSLADNCFDPRVYISLGIILCDFLVI